MGDLGNIKISDLIKAGVLIPDNYLMNKGIYETDGERKDKAEKKADVSTFVSVL